MVVLGAAEIPSYLFIDDDRVYFRPARRLWGAKSWETEEGVRRELGDDSVSVATIGPAMECFERGLVAREEVEGLELRFGNGEAVEAAELFRAATGLDMTAEELQKAGERVCNPKKAYNIREGWTRADDTLPPRILEEPLPTGIARGTALTREELSTMIL